MQQSTTSSPIDSPTELIQHSAGGLVFRRHRHDPNQIDVCMIQDSYGRWTFPKGHVEAGETLQEAAAREISEETGIALEQLRYIRELGEISYWFHSTFPRDGASPENPKRIHKFVTYYLFETPFDTELHAQEGEVEAITWTSLTDLDTKNEYEDNIPIIKQAKHYLAQPA